MFSSGRVNGEGGRLIGVGGILSGEGGRFWVVLSIRISSFLFVDDLVTLW